MPQSIFISILLLFLSLSLQAQEYFNKSYSPYLPYTSTQYIPVGALNSCETSIGYIMGGTYPTTDRRVLYIIVTNFNGDTISTKTYGDIGEVLYPGAGGGLFATIDGNFAISGSYKKDSLDDDGLLVKLSMFGDTLWTKKYGSPTEEIFYCGTQSAEGTYYLAGTAYDTVGLHYDMYVVKADSLGNTIWEKKYGGAESQSASNIQITMDGNVLISGYSGSGNTYNALAIKLDTAGNVLWTHSINTNGGGGNKFIETSDGGYLYYGGYKISSLPNYRQYFIQKLNGAKQVQWELKFADAVNRINSLAYCIEDNESFIFTGGHQDPQINKNHGIVLKVGSNGQIIWKRSINKFERDNYSYCIRKTSDGGFIIAGFGSEFLPNGMYSQEAWLCKVDSFGCLQQGCELLDVIEEETAAQQAALSIYPNPSKGIFYLQSSQAISQLSIYDISGKLVHTQNVMGSSQEPISLTLPVEGLYLLQVQYSNGTYESKKVQISPH
ncbi:MAG: T9SS type A sorting domain-containing protein [Bacteroidia bacterium]